MRPAAVTNAAPAIVTNAPPTAATNATTGCRHQGRTRAAAAAPLTPEQMFEGGTNAYNNWIEFGVGGFFTTGNKSQFQQQNQNHRRRVWRHRGLALSSEPSPRAPR